MRDPVAEGQEGVPREDFGVERAGDQGHDGGREEGAPGRAEAIAGLCPGRHVRAAHEEYGGAVLALGLHAVAGEESRLLWDEQTRHRGS